MTNSETEAKIRRLLRAASEEMARFSIIADVHRKQESWEDFLIKWRRAVEVMNHFADETQRQHIRQTRHSTRVADQTLTYAWEARNSEAHAEGSSTVGEVKAMTIGPEDPSKPVYIEEMIVNNGVVSISSGSSNWTVGHEGGLQLRPVKTRANAVFNEPRGVRAIDIAREAMIFARGYAADLGIG
ncbi:hypothetical protein [Mesorhizobium sp. 131-2-1]|uniref:hypothetical protein n=1 Tax=Mesorhizobium sp. 131-2-1 TaxID=2744518 RepID=UPI0019265E61|nr:hypothetical protein [Mesorhizobium sp. 131-2-1]BCG94460.1 hypothetical protein MesoLj131a_33240 [Mesorhizobium sp. 131-2-1]